MAEMLLGRVLVPDVSNPRPEDVDTEFMFERLGEIRRFCGNRGSLTVREHQQLCGLLAAAHGEPDEVVEWAHHHDDHEYATGDIATPLQKAFGMERIRTVQARWDIAICDALDLRYPTAKVAQRVAFYDRLALALEWRWCLGRDPAELGKFDDIAAAISDRAALDAVLAR